MILINVLTVCKDHYENKVVKPVMHHLYQGYSIFYFYVFSVFLFHVYVHTVNDRLMGAYLSKRVLGVGAYSLIYGICTTNST